MREFEANLQPESLYTVRVYCVVDNLLSYPWSAVLQLYGVILRVSVQYSL